MIGQSSKSAVIVCYDVQWLSTYPTRPESIGYDNGKAYKRVCEELSVVRKYG
jgi:hypothetical protein